jgi:mannose-6-phosphate isomerase-like protein (cupin superfamily)
MNRVFSIGAHFPIRDGTRIAPFLNSKDSTSGLPFDLLDGFSLASGEIRPGTSSKIHIMPHVTQVTFVRRGRVTVVMRDPGTESPYELPVEPEAAVLTRPGTFFQLLNRGTDNCEVLYIVSPAYVFVADGDDEYDDSIVIDESWQDLEKAGWQPPELGSPRRTLQARNAALARLGRQQ